MIFYSQYVAFKTDLREGEVELSLVLKPQANIVRGERTVDPDKDNIRVIGDQETLGELLETYESISCGYLVNSQS